MGVIDFGTGEYLVKFDDSYSDGLFAVQGDTSRTYHFIITDLSNQAINTSNLQLKMNIFVKRTKAGTAPSIRQQDGSFIMTIPQGLLLEHDENARYQLFITDGTDILSQKEGHFKIFANRSFDSGSGTNLLFDFEEFSRALEMQETYLQQMSDSLDTIILARQEVSSNASQVSADKVIVLNARDELEDVLELELERQANEEVRETKETARGLAETARGTNEAARGANETARTSAETTRQSSETARISAENTRKSNETARVNAETTRTSTFQGWITQFAQFVSNDGTYTTNETTRQSQWNLLKADLESLMEQLEDIDAASLQIQINTVSNNLKTYVKSMQVNTNTNSIEVFKGSDTDTPSIVLALPQGFSGNYNDLINKPSIYTQSEIDTKLNGKVNTSGSKVLSDYNYDLTAKNKVDAIPANPKYTDTIVDISGKFDKSGGTFTGKVYSQANTDYTTAQVRNIASGTTLPSASGFANGDIFILREN